MDYKNQINQGAKSTPPNFKVSLEVENAALRKEVEYLKKKLEYIKYYLDLE